MEKVGGKYYKSEDLTEPIDIILTTHGRLQDLTAPCVSALYSNTRNLFHLIIVDDSIPTMEDGQFSTPQWVDRLQIDYKNVTYIHSAVPYHSGNQIINEGLNAGNQRFIAVLGNSTIVQPDWDIEPVKMMANNSNVGIIGMKCLKLGWGEKEDGQIESAGIYMEDYIPCDMGRNEPGHSLSLSYPCFSVQWAFVLVRREAVIGNLDEDLWQGFVGWDDIDNSIYLRYKGWEAWYCGLGVGYHRTHATRGSEAAEILQKNRINGEIFYKRWGYWDLFCQKNPYAPEYYPDGKIKFLCNANELPLVIDKSILSKVRKLKKKKLKAKKSKE